MPLTKERNPKILKNVCLYCDRSSTNPCYLDIDNSAIEDRQKKTCPLRPMEFREVNRIDKSANFCSFCRGDGTTCNLSNDEFTDDKSRKKHCRMRNLDEIYPVISSTNRRRIMSRIDGYKAFFLKHGSNIIFMSGINAEGSAGGVGSGSKVIMDIVNPIHGYDSSRDDSSGEEDIGGVIVPRKRGRPSKEESKQRGREELMRKGLLEDNNEPKKSKNTEEVIGVAPKRGRGRPRKNPVDDIPKPTNTQEKNDTPKLRNENPTKTSLMMDKLLKRGKK